MSKTADEMALELAALVGELAGVVAWCVMNKDDPLGDNPLRLIRAKQLLAKTVAWMPTPQQQDIERIIS